MTCPRAGRSPWTKRPEQNAGGEWDVSFTIFTREAKDAAGEGTLDRTDSGLIAPVVLE